MTVFGIIFTIAIAIITGMVFYYVFRVKGPWGSSWTFIIILVLAGLAASPWITPYGPVFHDVAWVPILFVIVFIALLLAAATPITKNGAGRIKSDDREMRSDIETTSALAVLGSFFYLMIILLLAAAFFGIFAD